MTGSPHSRRIPTRRLPLALALAITLCLALAASAAAETTMEGPAQAATPAAPAAATAAVEATTGAVTTTAAELAETPPAESVTEPVAAVKAVAASAATAVQPRETSPPHEAARVTSGAGESAPLLPRDGAAVVAEVEKVAARIPSVDEVGGPISTLPRDAAGTVASAVEGSVREVRAKVLQPTLNSLQGPLPRQLSEVGGLLAASTAPVREVLASVLEPLVGPTVEALLAPLTQLAAPAGSVLGSVDRTPSAGHSSPSAGDLAPVDALLHPSPIDAGLTAPPPALLPGTAEPVRLQLAMAAHREDLVAARTLSLASNGPTATILAGDGSRPGIQSPMDVPMPAPASPAAATSGLSGSYFVPLAALLALLALAAPATLRRLREVSGIPAPTPFVCALERPG